MTPEQDPGTTPETDSGVVNGTPTGEQPATPTDTKPEPQQPQSNPELEALRKELNQAKMRENQLINQRKAEETKRLEEQNNFKELYEQTQAELKAKTDADTQAGAEREARDLRNSVIDKYDNPAVKEAAKKLLEKNDSLFYWSDSIDSPEAAQAAVKAQLDDIASVISPGTPETPRVPVDGNNPLASTHGANSAPVATGDELKALRERVGNIAI